MDNSQLASLKRVVTKLQTTLQRVQQAEERNRELETVLRQVEEEKSSALTRLHLAESRLGELEARLEELESKEEQRKFVERQIAEAEERFPGSWEVKEADLEMTDEVIGIGGWAQVKVARLKVAAKCLHPQLVYDYHDLLFQREMAMAARVSHPNLLRFLGAKLEGGMAIFTELIPTSLRAEVNRGRRNPEHRFSQAVIVSISIDVARALNYLHHMTPDAIIHRDLSSANVLLKPIENGGWLAKVSDYGSANFLKQLKTVNPGSPVYAAPESHNPALQCPKMDIYSFGVLVVEMCTCEFPVHERHPQLIELMQCPRLVELVRQCLDINKEMRPNAAQTIEHLQLLLQ